MTQVELAATTTPTQGLPVALLEYHARAVALDDLGIIADRLAHLGTLRWETTSAGGELPFSREELLVVMNAVRELAGRVREKQGV